MLKSLPLLLMMVIVFSCHNTKEMYANIEKKPQNPDNMTFTGHIIEKDFIKKNGVSAGFTELYFRASIQDYFIKLCESKVDRKTLEPFIDKAITVHAEIHEGSWDICPGDPQQTQSRIGNYMVINTID